jgi:hypothetical protein
MALFVVLLSGNGVRPDLSQVAARGCDPTGKDAAEHG